MSCSHPPPVTPHSIPGLGLLIGALLRPLAAPVLLMDGCLTEQAFSSVGVNLLTGFLSRKVQSSGQMRAVAAKKDEEEQEPIAAVQ